MSDSASRATRLDRVIADLLAQVPEVEAAAVVSFDGLPMASALPATMDEDRVAAMSAALLSLGERAAEGLGRGALSQVYIEGEHGTVFLVSADDEAVLVAVASKGAKVGMMLYEVRRAAAVIGDVFRSDPAVATDALTLQAPAPTPATAAVPATVAAPATAAAPAPAPAAPAYDVPVAAVTETLADVAEYAQQYAVPVEPAPTYAPPASDTTWPSYLPNGTTAGSTEPTTWS